MLWHLSAVANRVVLTKKNLDLLFQFDGFRFRLNFTLRHMDVSCEAYDHFRHCLDQLQQMTDGKMNFMVEPVKISFPQFFQYERVDQLVRSTCLCL